MQKNLLCAFLLLVSLVFTFNTVSATSNETEDSVRTNLKADLSNDSFHIQSSNIERILDQ
ncbi:hypothetical protein SAMN05421736_10729 [Evansella caseinilytica]|uniref:Uncharacterized protein n=1 Tax=Evansella caseinilytica TaxID=1503961 RepID=A0A1H3QSA9_9BACI|nr:hypothetical protein SAMN05421736_10729 [Evansella caseinilytica]